MTNPDRKTIYFPADASRVHIEENFKGLFEAYREQDCDPDTGVVSLYGTGSTVLEAIADLNREIEMAEAD